MERVTRPARRQNSNQSDSRSCLLWTSLHTPATDPASRFAFIRVIRGHIILEGKLPLYPPVLDKLLVFCVRKLGHFPYNTCTLAHEILMRFRPRAARCPNLTIREATIRAAMVWRSSCQASGCVAREPANPVRLNLRAYVVSVGSSMPETSSSSSSQRRISLSYSADRSPLTSWRWNAAAPCSCSSAS